jgi:hypothetical protein
VGLVDHGEPLYQGRYQRIPEIPAYPARYRIETRRSRHILPADGAERGRTQGHEHQGQAGPHDQHDRDQIPEPDIEREMGELMEGQVGQTNAHGNEQPRVHILDEPAGHWHDEKERDCARQEDQTSLIGRIAQQTLRQLGQAESCTEENHAKEQAHACADTQRDVAQHPQVDNRLFGM